MVRDGRRGHAVPIGRAQVVGPLAAGGRDFVVQPSMIAGLDKPTAGRVKVGRDYRAAPAPMTELGILLEATAMHPGRPARNHLPRFGARARQRVRSLA